MVVSFTRSGLQDAALPARYVADPFDRLFLQEYPRLVAIAARVLHDRAAAEDVAEAAETQRLVLKALTRLPERSALVLAMRYSGLSYAEIASAMRTRVG